MGTQSEFMKIGDKTFKSRLIVGTGKYKSFDETRQAIEISGAEMITVAVRRIELDKNKDSILNHLDPKRYTFLPNTAGCYSVKDAVMTCELAREAGLGNIVKVEVIGDERPGQRGFVDEERGDEESREHPKELARAEVLAHPAHGSFPPPPASLPRTFSSSDRTSSSCGPPTSSALSKARTASAYSKRT